MVSGGQDRWLILAEGKNSDQLVDVLLEEIGEGLLREKDFFLGLVWAIIDRAWQTRVQAQNSQVLLWRQAGV